MELKILFAIDYPVNHWLSRINKNSAESQSLRFSEVVHRIIRAILSPFLSAHYKSIGLSSTQIGGLFAVSPICAICIQPAWAYISDKTGKRRLVLGLLVTATAFSALLYYVGETFGICLTATVVMALFSSALLPLCDAIVIDLSEQFCCNFAAIRVGGTLGYALVVVLVGILVERFPSIHFGLGCAGYLVFALAVWRIPKGTAAERKGITPKHGNKSADRGIFVDKEIIFVLLFAFVMSLGLGFCGSFSGAYAVELGHTSKFIGMLSCISALSEVPFLVYARKLTSHFGEITLLCAAAVLISLRLFLTGNGQLSAMICGQLLQGVTYMTTYYCCTRYISTHVKLGKISQGQSVLTLVQSGLASVLGNLVGGWLVDSFGTKNAFHLMSFVVFILSILVFAAYKVYNRKNQHRKQVA